MEGRQEGRGRREDRERGRMKRRKGRRVAWEEEKDGFVGEEKCEESSRQEEGENEGGGPTVTCM